jgi:hypothetical protein
VAIHVLQGPAPAAGATHLTTQQLAARWACTTDTVMRWYRGRKNFLKPIRVGRRLLWALPEVLAYEEGSRASS